MSLFKWSSAGVFFIILHKYGYYDLKKKTMCKKAKLPVGLLHQSTDDSPSIFLDLKDCQFFRFLHSWFFSCSISANFIVSLVKK